MHKRFKICHKAQKMPLSYAVKILNDWAIDKKIMSEPDFFINEFKMDTGWFFFMQNIVTLVIDTIPSAIG